MASYNVKMGDGNMKKTAKTIPTFQFIAVFLSESSVVAFVKNQVWGDSPISRIR